LSGGAKKMEKTATAWYKGCFVKILFATAQAAFSFYQHRRGS
jgi:hypothetical protein